MADGRPGSHRRQRVVEKKSVGDVSPVVPSKPDLVHSVVEADDPILRYHLADVAHETLWRDGKAVFISPVGDALQNMAAQVQQCPGIGDPARHPVPEKLQARSKVADDLSVGKVDLLDVGRHVADVDHLGARPRPMMNGGFSTVS